MKRTLSIEGEFTRNDLDELINSAFGYSYRHPNRVYVGKISFEIQREHDPVEIEEAA